MQAFVVVQLCYLILSSLYRHTHTWSFAHIQQQHRNQHLLHINTLSNTYTHPHKTRSISLSPYLSLLSLPHSSPMSLSQSVSQSLQPLRVSLTGSICMGKSRISQTLSGLGFPVFDADAAVHRLYGPGGGAVEPLRALCPAAVDACGACVKGNAGSSSSSDGDRSSSSSSKCVCGCAEGGATVNRVSLMQQIMAGKVLLEDVEKVVHPLVEKEKFEFLERHRLAHNPILFYDIPLLFEGMLKREKEKEKEKLQQQEHAFSSLENKNKFMTFDYIMTVSANSETQRRRVMQRPGMTEDKFQAILSKQVPDQYKREHSDFVIFTHFEGFAEARSQLAQCLEVIFLNHTEKISHLADQFSGNRDDDSTKGIIVTDDFLFKAASLKLAKLDALVEMIHQQLPHFANNNSKQFVENKMNQIRLENPLIAHDDFEVMIAMLRSICTCDEEFQAVKAVLERNKNVLVDVSPFVAPEASALIALAKASNIKVGLRTEHNISASTLGESGLVFDTVLTNHDTGSTPSSIVPYFLFAQLWKLSPRQIKLHSKSIELQQLVATLGIKC